MVGSLQEGGEGGKQDFLGEGNWSRGKKFYV